MLILNKASCIENNEKNFVTHKKIHSEKVFPRRVSDRIVLKWLMYSRACSVRFQRFSAGMYSTVFALDLFFAGMQNCRFSSFLPRLYSTVFLYSTGVFTAEFHWYVLFWTVILISRIWWTAFFQYFFHQANRWIYFPLLQYFLPSGGGRIILDVTFLSDL